MTGETRRVSPDQTTVICCGEHGQQQSRHQEAPSHLRQGLDLLRELCGQEVEAVEAVVAVAEEVLEWRERPRTFPESGLKSVST